MRRRAMRVVDVLTALLARHGYIACAATELSVAIDVGILCTEGKMMYHASQRRVVLSPGRVVGEMELR